MPLSFSKLGLPKDWATRVRSGLLCAIAFARIALTEAHGQMAEESDGERVADFDQLSSEVALLREELRIKDVRFGRITPARRPHYPPAERLAILALKAARGWNAEQTAVTLFLSEVTIANWLKRIDEPVSGGYLTLREPVNRFPDFVRQVVQQLRLLSPTMGKVRIAQALARAGLRLSPSSVRQFLSQSPRPTRGPNTPTESEHCAGASTKDTSTRSIVAKRPNHVWHIDFTIVPTHAGFWVPWFPFVLVQSWPFAYCVAVVIDNFSRKVVAVEAFKKWPATSDVTDWLDTVIQSIGLAPTHLISDKGTQFREDYLDWCAARGIKPRFGAIGQHGAIAVVERFILSLKNECTRRILVPLGVDRFRQELLLYLRWYSEFRPHQSRGGRTPNEVASGATPAPVIRFEPRSRLFELDQRRRKRDADVVLVNALRLKVELLDGRAHLPIVHLERAA